jgi:hypothetical protein
LRIACSLTQWRCSRAQSGALRVSAELLWIVKPLLALAAARRLGADGRSWRVWLLPLVIDLVTW